MYSHYTCDNDRYWAEELKARANVTLFVCTPYTDNPAHRRNGGELIKGWLRNPEWMFDYAGGQSMMKNLNKYLPKISREVYDCEHGGTRKSKRMYDAATNKYLQTEEKIVTVAPRPLILMTCPPNKLVDWGDECKKPKTRTKGPMTLTTTEKPTPTTTTVIKLVTTTSTIPILPLADDSDNSNKTTASVIPLKIDNNKEKGNSSTSMLPIILGIVFSILFFII